MTVPWDVVAGVIRVRPDSLTTHVSDGSFMVVEVSLDSKYAEAVGYMMDHKEGWVGVCLDATASTLYTDEDNTDLTMVTLDVGPGDWDVLAKVTKNTLTITAWNRDVSAHRHDSAGTPRRSEPFELHTGSSDKPGQRPFLWVWDCRRDVAAIDFGGPHISITVAGTWRPGADPDDATVHDLEGVWDHRADARAPDRPWTLGHLVETALPYFGRSNPAPSR